MKKIYLFLISAFTLMSASQSYGQTQKGWYIIGGDISSLNVDFQQDNTNFSFDLTPRVAWFLKDNFAIGLSALLGVATTKTNSTTSTTVRYGIGPIARYYFAGKGVQAIKKTRWFADANVGIQGNNTKQTGQPNITTNGLGLGVGPGLAYFINQNIALEVLAKYNVIVGFGSSTTSNNLSLGIGFQIHLPSAKIKSMSKDVNTNN